MRCRGGTLKKSGELVRKYVCPACGETEIVKRFVAVPNFKKRL